MSRWRKDPLEVCGERHANATLEFHECVCKFDYRRQKKYQQALKYKHCLLADEMRRIDNFELYVIIAIVVGVVLIFTVAAFCSCKWYIQTNDDACTCCACLPCCKKKKKKTKRLEAEEREGGDGESSAEIHGFENGNHSWAPICSPAPGDPPQKLAQMLPSAPPEVDMSPSPPQERRPKRGRGLCMNFCLSDPVQDCCEFFDCDLLWHKKSIYTIPVFGRRKPPPMQRRPTRPAPPPPKPSAPFELKHPEPIHDGYDDVECEPVPEAPPSPEPIRIDQPRAMYVDPLSFLQRPFLRSTKEATKEKSSDTESEALYSKMKGFFGRGKKSGSVASLSQVGISTCPAPDATSISSSRKSKYSHTGSLASLNNLSEDQLGTSYNAKRSMSLASLHTVEEMRPRPDRANGRGLIMARSRGSLHNITEDDIPPSLRTDEYIDLEEMSKRIEAKMQAAQAESGANVTDGSRSLPDGVEPIAATHNKVAPSTRTPDFIPASVYNKSRQAEAPVVQQQHQQQAHHTQNTQYSPRPQYPVPSQYPSQQPRPSYSPKPQYAPQPYPPQPPMHQMQPPQVHPPSAHQRLGFDEVPQHHVSETANPKYYPPVPATPERPAVPARIAVGTPVVGTLGRSKPQVPPRPGTNSPRSGSNSPKPRAHQTSTLGRGGQHIIKPSAPPPPPPVNSTPIESAL